jgi:hypothetical protein
MRQYVGVLYSGTGDSMVRYCTVGQGTVWFGTVQWDMGQYGTVLYSGTGDRGQYDTAHAHFVLGN